MKSFGIALLLIAAVAGIFAFSLDTTVSTGVGRVQNLGLMSERQNILIICAALAIVGAIFATRAPTVPDGIDEGKSNIITRINAAVAAGNITAVEALLTEDLDVAQENEYGISPLKVAKSNHRTEILALFESHRLRQASKKNDDAS